MAIRDKLVAAAQPHLRPGEQVQAVIGAQNTSQYLMLAGVIPFVIINKYRIIAATDQRILLIDSGKSQVKGGDLLLELPRTTRLGTSNVIWHVLPMGPEKLRVHRRFFKDLQAADVAGGFPAA